MATSTKEDEDRTSKFAAVLKQTSPSPSTTSPKLKRKSALVRRVAVACVLLLGLGVIGAVVQSMLLSPAVATGNILIEKVQKADLVVSITEDGNVESAHNKDVKCEVQGGGTILWLIKDGTHVQAGEELARIDSSLIEDKVSQEEITYEKARALMIDAKNTFDAAKIAVSEYEEGTYQQSLQDLNAKATVARENLESSKNLLGFYNKMARNGYVTPLQRDAQEFAVKRAELDLGVAQTAIDVLEKFTKEKTLVGLRSARDSAEAKMRSEEAAFKLEEDRLSRLKEQLKKCTIVAPDNGMVIYANEQQSSGRGGGSQPIVEEGALVRERQTMIRLPDLSRMQVKCTVHESKVDSLTPGMRARIRIQDNEYQGVVTSVANQPEPSNFFTGNVKEYAAIVSIESDPHGLRPGMTAAIEILVAHLRDVLSVPVQAVVEKNGKYFCWVNKPNGPERRPVVLGMSNNTRIEVKDGLNEGEDVLLNPRATVEDARSEERDSGAVDVKKKFGGDKPVTLPSGNRQGPESQGANGKADARGGSRSFDLMSLDKDGDKKISREEAPEQLKSSFETIDTDHDGFIDAKEAAELRKKIQQRQQSGGGPPSGGS